MTYEESLEKAKELTADLSLEEKVAQIGGVMYIRGMGDRMAPLWANGLGEISCLCTRDMKSLEEVSVWQRQLQDEIMARSPHHIPVIFHAEALAGSFTPGATSLPSGVSRGSSFDTELEEKLGRMVAEQELACGFTHILAPVLDVARDPRMGRCGESYGEDPTLVAAMGSAYARGLQEAEVEGRRADAVAKHFFGFHTASGGIHGAHSDMTEHDLIETFGKPFQAAIARSRLRGVMPCYNSVNGEPYHTSEYYLGTVLRREMGFEGVIFSDYGGLSNAFEFDHVGESYEETGLMGLRAGMDVELPFPRCYNGKEFVQKFRDGEYPMELLDRACTRVLAAKYRMGLFENPYSLPAEEIEALYRKPRNRELTLQSARESLVLLKNENVLPIGRGMKKIAVIGPQAANARYFFGGYTHMDMATALLCAQNSMAGVGQNDDSDKPKNILVPGTNVQDDEQQAFNDILKLQKPDCRSLLEELTARLPETHIVWAPGYYKYGADESRFAEALDLCRDADLIIVTLGGKWGSGTICTMGEGIDTMDINLPAGQESFIRRAAELGRPMVGLAMEGRPISSDAADRYLDAIVECWCPSETGAQAIVDVLTGVVNPSGKLPVSTAVNAGQVPVYYCQPFGSGAHQATSIGFRDYVDGSHAPRYAFGSGLSYTSFEYSDLALSTREIAPDDRIMLSFTVANTGSAEGTEIPFLFVRDEHASVTRPCMLLSGFTRVKLAPGQKKRVTFTLDPGQNAFLTRSREIEWKIERGEYTVMVGSSADHILLTDSFTVTADRFIEGRTREFWAEAEVTSLS